jgi:hypothetical protein
MNCTVKLFPAAANCNTGQTMRKFATLAQKGMQFLFTLPSEKVKGPVKGPKIFIGL